MSIIFGRVPIPMSAQLAVSALSRPLLRYRRLQHKAGCFKRPGVGLRWINSQRKSATDSDSFACTWLTKTPEQITPDDVLSSIPFIPDALTKPNNVPVLLVTPGFSSWVDPANDFLERWMNRLFHNAPTPGFSASFHAIAAIVDRIPDVRVRSKNAEISGDNRDVSESEGLSLMFVREENVQGKAAAPRLIRSAGTEEPALIYSVQTGVPRIERSIYEVGLRLANTIFINGNENTLFGMRWTHDVSSNRLCLHQSVGLSNCTIMSSAKSAHDTLGLPLHPVSQRRKVISSMGNILRQISKFADGTSDAPMPASLELEKELPRYIAEHNIENQRVSVWALVEKPTVSVFDETDSPHVRLDKSIRAGGKLHRVMSGGGGWGKKQGLLSLDPETSFSAPVDGANLCTLNHLFAPSSESMPDMPPMNTQVTGDDLSLLSQVASAGDYIQFFVSVEPNLVQSVRSDTPTPTIQNGAISCHFGVVSDAEILDELIDGVTQKDLVTVPSYFGAASEKAITYLHPVAQAKSDGEVLESGTKLDMSGSRVEMIIA